MNFFRSIRFKTILVMFVCVALLLTATSYITSKTISGGFQDIENKKVKENIERLVDTYKFDLNNLGTKLSDWSSWDDTYKFIEDRNKAFVDSNLVYETLTALQIHYMIFLNNAGDIVASRSAQTRAGEDEIPPDLRALIKPGSSVVTHNSPDSVKTGLLMTSAGGVMFASRPIVTSAGKGPIRGTLIFGKFLDETEVNNLSGIVHLPVKMMVISATMPEEYRSALDRIHAEGNNYVKIRNESTIDGYHVLNDFFDHEAVIFKIEYPRDITLEGRKSIGFFMLSFFIAGILFLVVLAILISVFLISRVEYLANELRGIGERRSLGERVTVRGGDEIGILALTINDVLAKLQKSQSEVMEEKEKVKSFFDIVSGIVVVLSRGGTILDINKKGAEFLGVTPGEVIGRNWFDNFVPDWIREQTKTVFMDITDKGQIERFKYYESPVKTMTGQEYRFGWYNSVIKDEKGEVVATVSHGEDISEKKAEPTV